MNRRKFLITTATASVAATLPLIGRTPSTQEFIWNEIIPIAQRFDPQWVNLIPTTWWYDRRPQKLTDHIDKILAYRRPDGSVDGDRINATLSSDHYVKAHTGMIIFSKVKGPYERTRRDWGNFRKELFHPSRKNIEWDCVLINLKNSGMSYWRTQTTYSGHYISAFERGEQLGILIHPDSPYKGEPNCKMWNEYI